MRKRKKRTREKVLELTKWLADPMKWNWTRGIDQRSAADAVLHSMAELGLIGHKSHPYGGDTWIVGNQLFGRTDGVEPPRRASKIAATQGPH